MKKNIFLIISSIITIISIGIINSPYTNAIDLNQTGSSNISACSMLASTNVYGQITSEGSCQFITPNANGMVTRIIIDTATQIPAKSIITISGRYANDFNLGFIGIPGNNNLTPLASNTTINEGQKQLSFQYTFYTPTALNTLQFIGDLWTVNSGQVRIDLNPIQFVTLTNEPTREQIQQIETKLNNIYSVIINGITDDTSNISDKIDQVATDTATQTEIEENREEREQEDRDNLEERKDDTDTEANEAGSDASQTGQTLFQAFGQFVTALTNISGTSCRLPDMQIYSLTLNNMDLCQFNIPPAIMALASIGMVFIIVPLGIHLVKKMLNLYKEITG